MPRRLAVARHAEGTEPVGWVLIGFLLGAAAAIVTLTHADWIKRLPDSMAAAGATAVAPMHAPGPPPAPAIKPIVAAIAPSDAPPAAQPTEEHASTMAVAPAPGEDAQVQEDAAAAGMTSHAGAAKTDLN